MIRQRYYSIGILFLMICICQNVISAPMKFVKENQELRLAIGDMFFENLIWHDQIHKDYYGAPAGVVFTEDTHYRYMPHISMEYSYYMFPWMSVGGIVDFQNTAWHREKYDNTNRFLGYSKENFCNLSMMAGVRFTYLRREHIGLYSSLALGLDINGGSERDGFGHYTACGFAADVRLIGFKAGNGHWWGFVELGGMNALKKKSVIYMLGSELFKAGVSYKF